MDDQKFQVINCPLLGSLLAQKELAFKGTYSIRDAAAMFDVSVRAIQDRVSSGALQARSLPGHARFLAEDLEDFLKNSIKKNRGDDDR